MLTSCEDRSLTIRCLDPTAQHADWDAFLRAHDDSTMFHTLDWLRLAQSVYGYDVYACVAYDDDQTVQGVCPLVHVKTPLFGNALIATAFGTGGGILAHAPTAIEALQNHIEQLGHALGVDYVECRTRTATLPTWASKDSTYAGFSMTLDADSDARMQQFRKKKRNEIRKALKNDLTIETDVPVKDFYRVYAHSLRDHGTPVHTLAWYTAVKQAFGDNAQTLLIRNGNEPLCACMALYYKDTVTPHYSGGLKAARPHKAFDVMYWTLMDLAAQRNAPVFDFGRSKRGTGAEAYKLYWGFEPQTLAYQYYMPDDAPMPDVNPNNPKYATFVKLWQHLPVWVANQCGPLLARQLG